MKFDGKNISIGKNVKLGKNVRIGDNTMIYDNVIIGDNTIICDNCSIGEPQNAYYFDNSYQNPTLKIGANSLIRSHAIIYAGSSLGDYLQMGHYSIIRENNIFGNHCMVGIYVNILDGCKIGNYDRFHSYVQIAEKSVIEDFVFFFPNVIITSDPTPPSNVIKNCFFGAYSQILANVLVLPDTHIGKHCVVAAQTRVRGTYKDYSFIAGEPPRRMFDTRKVLIINEQTRKRQYPWPYNFSKNMPWNGIGYEEWLKNNHND
jgi:UDP-3-O-[3-hydroxymyristoyl] glucosamine N-acyltransferase